MDGFTRKVVIGYGDKLDEEGLRKLQVVRQSAGRMGKLIDDLLAVSRLGRREMHLVPNDSHVSWRKPILRPHCPRGFGAYY